MFYFTSLMPATHLIYLVISIVLTIWVARTLRKHGHAFLSKGCQGDEELAVSLGHLLSTGFYLLHIGGVLLALRYGTATDITGSIELLSTKVGLVLVVLAISHFVYLALYTRIYGKPKPSPEPAKPAYGALADLLE